jgi:hypothetical protein
MGFRDNLRYWSKTALGSDKLLEMADYPQAESLSPKTGIYDQYLPVPTDEEIAETERRQDEVDGVVDEPSKPEPMTEVSPTTTPTNPTKDIKELAAPNPLLSQPLERAEAIAIATRVFREFLARCDAEDNKALESLENPKAPEATEVTEEQDARLESRGTSDSGSKSKPVDFPSEVATPPESIAEDPPRGSFRAIETLSELRNYQPAKRRLTKENMEQLYYAVEVLAMGKGKQAVYGNPDDRGFQVRSTVEAWIKQVTVLPDALQYIGAETIDEDSGMLYLAQLARDARILEAISPEAGPSVTPAVLFDRAMICEMDHFYTAEGTSIAFSDLHSDTQLALMLDTAVSCADTVTRGSSCWSTPEHVALAADGVEMLTHGVDSVVKTAIGIATLGQSVASTTAAGWAGFGNFWTLGSVPVWMWRTVGLAPLMGVIMPTVVAGIERGKKTEKEHDDVRTERQQALKKKNSEQLVVEKKVYEKQVAEMAKMEAQEKKKEEKKKEGEKKNEEKKEENKSKEEKESKGEKKVKGEKDEEKQAKEKETPGAKSALLPGSERTGITPLTTSIVANKNAATTLLLAGGPVSSAEPSSLSAISNTSSGVMLVTANATEPVSNSATPTSAANTSYSNNTMLHTILPTSNNGTTSTPSLSTLLKIAGNRTMSKSANATTMANVPLNSTTMIASSGKPSSINGTFPTLLSVSNNSMTPTSRPFTLLTPPGNMTVLRLANATAKAHLPLNSTIFIKAEQRNFTAAVWPTMLSHNSNRNATDLPSNGAKVISYSLNTTSIRSNTTLSTITVVLTQRPGINSTNPSSLWSTTNSSIPSHSNSSIFPKMSPWNLANATVNVPHGMPTRMPHWNGTASKNITSVGPHGWNGTGAGYNFTNSRSTLTTSWSPPPGFFKTVGH